MDRRHPDPRNAVTESHPCDTLDTHPRGRLCPDTGRPTRFGHLAPCAHQGEATGLPFDSAPFPYSPPAASHRSALRGSFTSRATSSSGRASALQAEGAGFKSLVVHPTGEA